MQTEFVSPNILSEASLEKHGCAIFYLFLKLNYFLAKATLVPDNLHMVSPIDTEAQSTHDL